MKRASSACDAQMTLLIAFVCKVDGSSLFPETVWMVVLELFNIHVLKTRYGGILNMTTILEPNADDAAFI